MQLEWELIENKKFDKRINDLTGFEVLSQILANRGIDTFEKAQVFLNPQNYSFSDPENFVDMKKAVARIKEAIEKSQNIVICGDFDCDGVTSTAILFKTLVKIGAKVGCYIPSRQNESHGLNSKAIIEIISKQRAKLIITVDNGISNNSEIKLAQSLGTDVIITDHHEPSEVLPEAFAIINPKCSGKMSENLEFDEIQNMVNFAGVMVTYKLCCALLDEYKYNEYKKKLLPYVMIGTISDVMPLTMENRAIVSSGLEYLEKNAPKWLVKLLELAQKDKEKIDVDSIAFVIAPRINAAGRLDNATIALELLVSDDDEKINFCANQLNQFNQTRQQMCDTSFYEAVARIQKEIDLKTTKAIVLADENWHIGIVGLLASKIVEVYNRPAFVISIDKTENKARCSIRGIKGLSIHKVLTEMSDLFETYGGHELAGGFCSDLNKISIKELSNKIQKIVFQQLDGKNLRRKINIDAILSPKDLTENFIEKLAILEPYGEANRPCVFGMENLILKKFDVIGQNSHMKMCFESEDKSFVAEGIIWNKNNHVIELLDKVDLTFIPKINEYKGKKTIQMIIKNIFIKNREIEIENMDFDENAKNQALLVDHRRKNNFFKMLNSYLTNNKADVYLENKEIISQISDYDAIKNVIKNRFNISHVEELILISSPCSEEDFAQIIKDASPKKVHVFNCNENKFEINEFIKTISGMLKYCAMHFNGEIEIKKSICYLASTKEAFCICLELLNNCGVIKILSKTNEKYLFEFVKSKALSELLNNTKYKELYCELEKINNFKENFQTCEISQIKEMLEN